MMLRDLAHSAALLALHGVHPAANSLGTSPAMPPPYGADAAARARRPGRAEDRSPQSPGSNGSTRLLNAVIAIDPTAIAQARAIDASASRGPLAGEPVLLKDNIEAAGPLPTTAGSLALANNVTNRDAPLVARLAQRGRGDPWQGQPVGMGQYPLDQIDFRLERVGGQTRNPYALDRNTLRLVERQRRSGRCRAWCAMAIGTETDGSVTCPAAINGIVGLKPTVGLVSRTHIVPISDSQDTAGPMAASVREAAELLTVIAGSDPADRATREADRRKRDYAASLDADSLGGKRIGVMRFATGFGTDLGVRRSAWRLLAGSAARPWSTSTEVRRQGDRRQRIRSPAD